MESGSDYSVNEFRRRIEAILRGSFQWVSWQRALEATLLDGYLAEKSSPEYCVDTHLVIEFLLPRPLKDLFSLRELNSPSVGLENYPRPLDLALFLLLCSEEPIKVLPPHHQEFWYKVHEWQQQLVSQNEKLELFQAALERLIETVGDEDDAVEGDRFRYFLEAVLSEEGGFSGILALETRGVRSLTAIKRRLQVVGNDSLSALVENWQDPEPRGRIDAFFNALSSAPMVRATATTNRIDAHALYLLEKENEARPAESHLVLLTQSAKIWSLLSNREQCEALAFRPRHGRVWMIQPPEVVLISAMANKLRSEGEDGAGEREARRLLILDLEQNRRLRLMRDEVEHEILPRLDLLSQDSSKWSDCKLRVQQLEDGLRELKSVSQDRDRLLTLRLGLDSPQNWGGALFDKLRSLRGAPQAELRSTLSWQLERLRKRIRELEEQMLIDAPLPSGNNSNLDELQGVSPELHGFVRNQAEGILCLVRLQSPSIISYLGTIMELLHQLDARAEQEREVIVLDLHSVMRDAKLHCQEEPEYQLMLAALYADRGLWFESYVAANQGLRRLLAMTASANLVVPQARFEAILLKGTALQHWALAQYSNLPIVAGQFLEEAADCIRQALSVHSQALSEPLGTREDPRAIRELATIYGNARELEVFSRRAGRLKPNQNLFSMRQGDLELVGAGQSADINLLDMYRALAERAFELAGSVPSMYGRFLNTLLFALVEVGRDEDSERRAKLASELEAITLQDEPINSLDTLAWYHFRNAQRARDRGEDPTFEVRRSREYLERIRGKLRVSKRTQGFYENLVKARERELRQFRKE